MVTQGCTGTWRRKRCTSTYYRVGHRHLCEQAILYGHVLALSAPLKPFKRLLRPVVPQDVPQLQLAAAAAEALPRTGGGAGLQQLAGRAQAGAGGAAAPGRREPADGGRAPPGAPAALRAGRAPGRGTGGGRSCATVNEDASGARLQPAPALRAGGGPLVVRHKPLLPGRFCAGTPTPGPCSTRLCIPRKASALPQRPRTRTCGWRGGTKEPALLRTTWRETPRPAPWPATGRGRPPSRTACAALQTGRGARSRAGLPLAAVPGRGRLRAPERAAPSGPGAAASADHRPAQRRGAHWLRRRERWLLPPRAWAERLGTWAAWLKEQQPWRPPRARLLERWLARRELARRGWPLGLQAAQPTAWRAARARCWRTRSSGPSRAARTRPCRTSGPPTT